MGVVSGMGALVALTTLEGSWELAQDSGGKSSLRFSASASNHQSAKVQNSLPRSKDPLSDVRPAVFILWALKKTSYVCYFPLKKQPKKKLSCCFLLVLTAEKRILFFSQHKLIIDLFHIHKFRFNIVH